MADALARGKRFGARLVPGTVLEGRYRLESILGAGSFGVVWQAHHVHLQTECAVKLFDPPPGADLKDASARFLMEARLMARLKCPHVAQVFDFGVHESMPFLVLELLRGTTLAAHLQELSERGLNMPSRRVVHVLRHVAEALHVAHAARVVHRDLKPDNIFLVQEGSSVVAKVLDFGIAKWNAESLPSMTTTRVVMGTPHYMSPEQFESARQVDHRADLWSLGVIAFECLTGSVPFPGEGLIDVAFRVIRQGPLVASQIAEVPPGFDRWFARATALDREFRFESAREQVHALAEACSLPPPPRAPVPAAAAAVVAAPARAGAAAPLPVGAPHLARADLVARAAPRPESSAPSHRSKAAAFGHAAHALRASLLADTWTRLGGLWQRTLRGGRAIGLTIACAVAGVALWALVLAARSDAPRQAASPSAAADEEVRIAASRLVPALPAPPAPEVIHPVLPAPEGNRPVSSEPEVVDPAPLAPAAPASSPPASQPAEPGPPRSPAPAKATTRAEPNKAGALTPPAASRGTPSPGAAASLPGAAPPSAATSTPAASPPAAPPSANEAPAASLPAAPPSANEPPAASSVNEKAAMALTSVAALASSCRPRGGPTGMGKARVIFANDGTVQSVEILTALFRDNLTGSCVRMVFKRARIDPFQGEPPTFIKSFTIPEE